VILIQDGDVKALEEFFETNADEEKMLQYMPNGGGLRGFVEYLIDNEIVDEKKDPSVITWKDRGRIEDMVKRADGNETKLLQMATRMAKSIKDGFKALRRGLAAEDENYHAIAKIFFDRAKALGRP